MLSFKKHWSEEIAEVTSSADYQTCEMEILDPSLVQGGATAGNYNLDTGEYTEIIPAEAIVYSGQARLISVRRGVNYEGANQNNSKTISAIRVQLPAGSLPQRLRKGFTAKVTSAPRNPTLEGYVYYLATDIHGASAATRTLEFNVDGDSIHE